MGWTRGATGYHDSYEPHEHLDKSHMHPKLRVFVLFSFAKKALARKRQS